MNWPAISLIVLVILLGIAAVFLFLAWYENAEKRFDMGLILKWLVFGWLIVIIGMVEGVFTGIWKVWKLMLEDING
jgi:hypothetical protein